MSTPISDFISHAKHLKCLVLLLFPSALVSTGWAQTPPPNDNYTNRIQLVGTDVTFSGTCVGASREDYRENNLLGNAGVEDFGYPTVWWTWTPQVSGPVTIDLTSYSDPRIKGDGSFIALWDFMNWDPDPNATWGTSPYGKNLDLPGNAQFSFHAEAGTNYDIMVSTPPYGTFTFHLVQTNAPLVLVQPRDRAVAVNDSTFFGVMPGGLGPFTYQWRFNGVDLPGETHSLLAVENVDSTKAGSYSVMVSNSYGAVESSAAILTVRTNFLTPRLSVVGVNADSTINFTVSGERLTYYRIQSSSNLVDWTNEVSFPVREYRGYISGFTSVILNNGLTTTVTVPFSGQGRFYRAVVYQPIFNPTNGTLADSRLCINNLRRVRFAKEFWFTERTFDPYDWSRDPTDTPTLDELDWGADLTGPHCSGGQDCMGLVYIYNDGLTFPVCSADSQHHVLEEPADDY